ncbi:MAG: sigma factor [Lachnospiraceae bacterium]|nr:sigma factor [Lachnospiraceae bacterium]
MSMNQEIQLAKQNPDHLEQLILAWQPFIRKTAAGVCRRYISRQDDEWSIAISAFAEAVDIYEPLNGAFQPFAALVIRRRLIDYFRNQSRFGQEISMEPEAFYEPDSEPDEPGSREVVRQLYAIHQQKTAEEELKLEIEAVSQEFSAFGFTFFDVAKAAPKAAKTRKSCGKAATFLLEHPLLIAEFRKNGQLPLKIMEKESKVPRKILERHRIYIIAVIVILTGEYPQLAEYMHTVTGNQKDGNGKEKSE